MKRIMFSLLITLLFISIACNDDIFQYSVHAVKSTYQKQYNFLNLIHILSNPPPDPDNFTIALIADTHDNFDILCDTVNSINSNPSVSFIIHLGDFAHNGMLFQYEKTIDIMLNLQKPFLVVMGNHDCLSNGKDIYNQIFGPSDMAFAYGNTYFVLVNNNTWETSTIDISTFISMVEKPAGNPDIEHRLAISHIPIFSDNRFSVELQERYMNLLSENDFDMSIHGHTHRYSFTEEEDKVTTLIVDDIGDRNYCLMHISGERINLERVFF